MVGWFWGGLLSCKSHDWCTRLSESARNVNLTVLNTMTRKSFWGSFGCAQRQKKFLQCCLRGEERWSRNVEACTFLILFCACDARITVTTAWVCWPMHRSSRRLVVSHVDISCYIHFIQHLLVRVRYKHSYNPSQLWWKPCSSRRLPFELHAYWVLGINEEYLCVYTQTKVPSFCRWTFFLLTSV